MYLIGITTHHHHSVELARTPLTLFFQIPRSSTAERRFFSGWGRFGVGLNRVDVSISEPTTEIIATGAKAPFHPFTLHPSPSSFGKTILWDSEEGIACEFILTSPAVSSELNLRVPLPNLSDKTGTIYNFWGKITKKSFILYLS